MVLAGPDAPALEALAAGLGAAARVVRLDPGALGDAEAAVAAALATPGLTALLAASPCPLGEPRGAPLGVDPARCNRCGACLALGCPALADDGGEAMRIDPAICTGCGRCAPLCRGRAIHE